jgi:hypothetical protein
MCDCIEKLNEQLKERNTRIVMPISFSSKGLSTLLGPIIATEKADPTNRKKPVKLMASYCPFCGEKKE